MKKKITVSEYKIVENCQATIELPTKTQFYYFGWKSVIALIPLILEGKKTPYRYKWIYVEDSKISMGLLTVSEIERLLSFKEAETKTIDGHINLKIIHILMSEKPLGDIAKEKFMEQFENRVNHMNRMLLIHIK